MRYRAFAPILLAGVILVAGCGWSHHGDDGYFADLKSDTTPLVLGAGDLMITNRDSSVDLALAGDRVVMQFSERTRRKLRHDLDTTRAGSKSDFGAYIERTVKRQVTAMLDRRLERPLAGVRSIDFQDGTIEIDAREKHRFSFDNVKADHDRPALATFAPADAQRFVAAVRARMADRGAERVAKQ
jgi:hypothetical protein